MKKKVLFVIDMQKDFMHGGKLGLPHETLELENSIAELIKSFNGDVIFTKDSHLDNDCEFAIFPAHCVLGTDGHDLADPIQAIYKDGKKRCTVIGKSTFGPSDMRGMTRTVKDYEIHVVGVCTHICVHDTIVSIVNTCKEMDNIMPDITIHKDLVSDFDPEMAAFALKRLQNLYGVKVI